VVWRRGILKKGFGLCHGISGNGMALLTLYRVTQNPLWLGRAVHFGVFSLEWASHIRVLKTPDHPLSLFEGLGGLATFFLSLLHPEDSHFPAIDE
jgi:hypothetical protein